MLLFHNSFSARNLRGLEDTSMGEFIFIYACPFIATIIIGCYLYLRYNEIDIRKITSYIKPLNDVELLVLEKFPYYLKLPINVRDRYKKRVKYFIINKKFIGADSIEITDEMKVHIAAACAQLTIGFKPTFLSNFKTVQLFLKEPDKRNENLQKEQLLIFWKEFKAGFDIENDGINHGLKTLAEALCLETRVSNNTKYTFGERPYSAWNKNSKEQMHRFLVFFDKEKIFTNLNEDQFFGIAVVYFFERPKEFKSNFPSLYHGLKIMLKQDSLRA